MKVGILGGGQLARMLALSGLPLNIQSICHDNAPDACAKMVTEVFSTKDFSTILQQFKDCDCLTYETENLAYDWVSEIANHFPIYPSLETLRISQDRLLEKDFFNRLGISTAPYQSVENAEELIEAIEHLGTNSILKTRLQGYDGKGQAVIKTKNDAKKIWDEQFCGNPSILESKINFDFEISMIAASNQKKEFVYYPLVRNHHQNGILKLSEAPFIDEKLESEARDIMRSVMEHLDYRGVLTIEFFVLNNKLIVNEMAPRVHNSGHFTIDASMTSQFENHLRAILTLPLGSTQMHSSAKMINLIGINPDPQNLLSIQGLHYHWYGKELKPNRKLGHITLTGDTTKDLSIAYHELSKLL